jgi:hypothetical protein
VVFRCFLSLLVLVLYRGSGIVKEWRSSQIDVLLCEACKMDGVVWVRLLRANVIACCISASVVVGFDLDARSGSFHVCQRQFIVGENSEDLVAPSRGCECARKFGRFEFYLVIKTIYVNKFKRAERSKSSYSC